ncbi:FAD-dependent oxidoreductase [Thalassobacillus pellis]|uniref:FAD-dependent oxidoreductase n=1 Tax=Thalassobacillus pellis TaxID=748008 RepID=UPI001961FF6B|nr:FAD-dependent oxidoreductase [Thalassobacillus pellis]MBM7553810.1 flavin-dependent dehydrogenase [Thalassobacillus pellis]
MNVAIIGAGMAGLSCALTLEKHGMEFDIFEQRKDIKNRKMVAEAMTPILHKPFDDAVKYLAETYQIPLKPTSNIRKLYVHSPDESAELEGNLGFINMRGNHEEAYEKQLSELLKTPIQFGQDVSYKEISKDYTHIVLATGDPLDTQKFQPFDTAYKATFAGAIVEGDFVGNEVHTWFNDRYAPKGMGYILPHSDKEGSLILVYPQYQEDWVQNKDSLWKDFFAQAEITLDQELTIAQDFQIGDYIVGKSKFPRIGNTFFVGNCLGAITPFFGFGQFGSILSGIYAAEDLCGLDSYEKKAQSLYKNYHDSLTLRRAIERLDNDKLDMITKSMKLHVVESMITGPSINLMKIISTLLHPFGR